MLRRGNHPCVYHVLIGIERGVLTICPRNLRPQALGTLPAPISHVKGHYLTGLGVHRDPDPLLVGLLVDKAAHFIRFHRKLLNHHVTVTGDQLAAAVMALMVLFTVVDVAIFLVLGRLTPWTHISDDHRVLLTSAGVGSVFGQR
jgi:hypothetical protein